MQASLLMAGIMLDTKVLISSHQSDFRCSQLSTDSGSGSVVILGTVSATGEEYRAN